ncbi:hypothetical protein EJC51_06350 [Streptomyces aquilus]|uniref:Uncharacterized protein n=1 Tax=Streptomyces aquilus TaxID=2548456 RepID=A0A3Q9BX00_9ACTN|nr:hypothetical protein [Streptomyces aquilus]AZP15755.1 hypothetical protein EJC51_06350 [Streptomyces aquilus]
MYSSRTAVPASCAFVSDCSTKPPGLGYASDRNTWNDWSAVDSSPWNTWSVALAKPDSERLLLVSPELADALSTIIRRLLRDIDRGNGTLSSPL